MCRNGKIAAGTVAGLLTILVTRAFALANFSLTTGTIAAYDFGGYGPGYPVPGTVQVHGFTMKPGDAVPWHYHKATSYVILVRGTLTEQHVIGPGLCQSERFSAGAGFIEGPGQVHTVVNTGNDVSVILWATAFPQSDGITEFSPEFKAGGVYPAAAPGCTSTGSAR